MGVNPNITPFPGTGTLMTKAKLRRELANLREQLLPFYEDDESELDREINTQKSTIPGAVGMMTAIAWCHGQLGLYRFLHDEQEDN